MKKYAWLVLITILTGCAEKAKFVEYMNTENTVVEETAQINIPCSYACTPQTECSETIAEPLVLKPRVTEEVSTIKTRRCCPEDKLVKNAETKTIIPELPEIYVIAANRTANSMLNFMEDIFYTISSKKGDVKVYIEETTVDENDLPKGIEAGTQAIRNRLSNIPYITVTDKQEDSDLQIKTNINWFDTSTKTVPAIKYTLSVYENDFKAGDWYEIIRQTENDRSWW